MWALPNILGLERTTEHIRHLQIDETDLQDLDARDGRMWPKAWDTPAHLHIIFGVMKKGLKAKPQWVSLEKAFRAAATFVSRRGLRKRLVSKCCEGRRAEASIILTWYGGN